MSRFFVPLLALILAAGVSGCGGEERHAGGAGGAQETKAISVSFETVEKRTLVEPVNGTGTITANRATDIGPSVDGIIAEVMVRVGDRVKAGQPLFRTRDVEFKLKVQELEGRVALARAENRNAQDNLARALKLGRTGVASEGKVDDAQASADGAKAQLAVAEAQLAQAQQSLDDTVTYAPYDAVVTRRDVDEGRFMVSRMAGGQSSGVVQLMQIDVVLAIVQTPETNLPLLSLGLPAKLYVTGMATPVDSKVTVINDRVDPVTRGIEVRLQVQNSDYAIKPGTFVRAEIFPPGREALVLSRSAVLGSGSERYVFVAHEEKARRVTIKTRELDAARLEVLSGLSAGDKVLSGPNLRGLIEGTPILVASNGVAEAGE